MEMEQLPFGPVEEPLIFDNFSYEDVKTTHCVGKVCENICSELLTDPDEHKKYLTICVPCYNEDLDELLKTLYSLMENVEFMQRKARLYEDEVGQALKHEFINTVPIIVPIFDGIKAMSPSIKEWMRENFPGAIDDLEDAPSGPGLTDVRVTCGKWWYYCDDTLPNDETAEGGGRRSSTGEIDNDELARKLAALQRKSDGAGGGGSFRASLSRGQFSQNISAEHIIYFNMAVIVKRSNHRKHNSHQWFFDGICQGLDTRNSFAFLTDCGTTYNSTCLARLFYELRLKKDLIGVTARQRVETPGLFFHPCEDSPFSFLKGDHKETGDMRPCWKCYATYYMSPCPLQGFEFEATLIMNSAMFNIVEALPVMPGPCQLLNWQKMKEFRVVEEYFNLLFKGESDKRIPSMPHKFKRMGGVSSGTNTPRSMSRASSISGSPRSFSMGNKSFSGTGLGSGSGSPKVGGASSPKGIVNTASEDSALDSPKSAGSANSSTAAPSSPVARVVADTKGITFTEFLRVNMRLAEDRILSFVCVFSTGFGTKWIPGATFFYQPEIRWETLLTQRRRWLNGTFASFLFFFNSKRAADRIKGGMFDSHKAGKNIRLINGLWSLQLVQLVLVLFAPAVFGSASYIALIEMSNKWKLGFGWAQYSLFGPVRVAELWIFTYFFVYVLWTFRSFYAPRGRMPEVLCRSLAIAGFFVVLPVYLSVWWTVAQNGLDVINVLVIGSLGLPVVIALAQSVTSAGLYLFYLPWFMFLIVFFLVYIPSYSFARLWDTTWGNRATGNDSAITDSMVDIMKSRNFIFICCLTTVNCLAAWAFIGVFKLGYNAVLGFMLVVFFPMIIQLIFSFVFLFLAVPMRYLGLRPTTTTHSVQEKKIKGMHADHYNQRQDQHSDVVEQDGINPIISLSNRSKGSSLGSTTAAEDLESGAPAPSSSTHPKKPILKVDTNQAPGSKVTFQRGL